WRSHRRLLPLLGVVAAAAVPVRDFGGVTVLCGHCLEGSSRSLGERSALCDVGTRSPSRDRADYGGDHAVRAAVNVVWKPPALLVPVMVLPSAVTLPVRVCGLMTKRGLSDTTCLLMCRTSLPWEFTVPLKLRT